MAVYLGRGLPEYVPVRLPVEEVQRMQLEKLGKQLQTAEKEMDLVKRQLQVAEKNLGTSETSLKKAKIEIKCLDHDKEEQAENINIHEQQVRFLQVRYAMSENVIEETWARAEEK